MGRKGVLYRGKTLSDWARRLGITYPAVKSLWSHGTLAARIEATDSAEAYRRSMRRHCDKLARDTQRRDDEIAKLYDPSKPRKQIAAESGVLYLAIDRVFRKRKLAYPSRAITCAGKSARQWSSELGVTEAAIRWHIRRGDFEAWAQAVAEGLTNPHNEKYRGKTRKEWAEVLGITRQRVEQLLMDGTLGRRIRSGSSAMANSLGTKEWLARVAKRSRKLRAEIRRAHDQHKTLQEIANEAGVSVDRARGVLKQSGLRYARNPYSHSGKPRKPGNSASELAVLQAWSPTKTLQQIAWEAGQTYQTTRRVLQSNRRVYTGQRKPYVGEAADPASELREQHAHR